MLKGELVPSTCVILTHAAERAVSGRELRFMVLDGDARKLVASGTMVQA
jgi:hypothetical protein